MALTLACNYIDIKTTTNSFSSYRQCNGCARCL